MKRVLKISSVLASLAIISCSACTNDNIEPTSLDETSITTKSIICGHVRMMGRDKTGALETPYPASPGQEVQVFYAVPDGGSVKEYALKTITTDANGYFEIKIGCPFGKSLKVKVESCAKGDTYALNESGKYVSTQAYFFSSIEKDAECGKATYYALDMTPVANISEGGLK